MEFSLVLVQHTVYTNSVAAIVQGAQTNLYTIYALKLYA
jgi:hypothetical protein